MAQYASYKNFGRKEETVQGNVTEIQDLQHKNSILEKSKHTGQLVVVDIWGSWCGPCKACRPAYEALSLKYPSVIFCSEDVTKEMTPEATVVPWFQFFGKGYLIEDRKGANMKEIENVILRYIQRTENTVEKGIMLPQNRRSGENPNINRNPPQKNYDIQRPSRVPHGIRK